MEARVSDLCPLSGWKREPDWYRSKLRRGDFSDPFWINTPHSVKVAQPNPTRPALSK